VSIRDLVPMRIIAPALLVIMLSACDDEANDYPADDYGVTNLSSAAIVLMNRDDEWSWCATLFTFTNGALDINQRRDWVVAPQQQQIESISPGSYRLANAGMIESGDFMTTYSGNSINFEINAGRAVVFTFRNPDASRR
jgi:hypothetical protein